MRLLTQDDNGELKFHRFFNDPPPYAVLSHVRQNGMDEVTCHDILHDTFTSKSDYPKISHFLQQAERDGLEYLWVETCCIDKGDRYELSEALNSMFNWFRDAAKCYVYLSDVSTENWELSFRDSEWFTQSWTLQELIAPRSSVDFFSSSRQQIGDKNSMEQCIHEITGIPIRALRGDPLSEFSVAERMSWAVHRRAARPEDQVYSLLGILGVRMPIIYGEGSDRAFLRLYEKIKAQPSISLLSNSTHMRLLLTISKPPRMETVPANENPQYAILSHTWGNDEVSFEDMGTASIWQKKGYLKIIECCDLAAKHGFKYLWVDTCCINKSSSSELQEAILSMYKWYKNAKVCYVYLEDCKNGSPLNQCRWFTRGWTLQELIAPNFVEFYDRDWNEIGTKQSLCDEIAGITSIDPLILRGADPTKRTIAERMSWAASRSTARIEDAAYSLMGLFNVFMPMLYGEGRRAFIRLQEEIIKQTEDYTIFSWEASHASGPDPRGIFAHSPAEFLTGRPERNVTSINDFIHQPDHHPPPDLTSRGLRLSLPVMEMGSREDSYLWAWVSCFIPPQKDIGREDPTLLCIWLREVQSSPRVFARSFPNKVESVPMKMLRNFKHRTLFVLPFEVHQSISSDLEKPGEVKIHPLNNANRAEDPMLLEVADGAQWWDKDMRITYSHTSFTGPLASIRFGAAPEIVVVIGLYESMPWCSIITREDARQQRQSLNILGKLSYFSRSNVRHTDRAEKMLSATMKVTAAIRVALPTDPTEEMLSVGAMRVARFANADVLGFGLHVTLVEVYDVSFRA